MDKNLKNEKTKLKEFLKPTKWKILLFILLMVVMSLYACWQFFSVGCIQGCILLPDGSMDCPACPLCHIEDILPFSLGLIIPSYLLACFWVYLCVNVKNKLKKKKEKSSY